MKERKIHHQFHPENNESYPASLSTEISLMGSLSFTRREIFFNVTTQFVNCKKMTQFFSSSLVIASNQA